MLLRGAKGSENRRGEDGPLLQALEKARPANCGFRFLASRTMREEICFGCQCSAALAWGSVGGETELSMAQAWHCQWNLLSPPRNAHVEGVSGREESKIRQDQRSHEEGQRPRASAPGLNTAT